MTLRINQRLQAELSGDKLTVKKKLGEGTQGEVFLVEGLHGKMALKWYNLNFANEYQKKTIKYLVSIGAPENGVDKRFVWPLDLVSMKKRKQFGYLMSLIDTHTFALLGEVQNKRRPQPGAWALCEIGYQLANSYRSLHLTGHCYRDISAGNLMFNPQTGDVLICDNDNVGINRQSKCQIMGTMEYMAPEIITGMSDPSTDTDLHSLAVLLFNLWLWHHPLHGDLECQIHIWDLPAKKLIYGENPVFIFNPNNTSNRPNDPDYYTVRKRWEFCPNTLKQTFIRAFTIGLKEPERRVTEGEWQRLFLELQDGIVRCIKCNAENLWDVSMSKIDCWYCKKQLTIPPKLVIKTPNGKSTILLTSQMKLKSRHIDPHNNIDNSKHILADLTQHPHNPHLWGIRNLTNLPWHATFPDGKQKNVPPQRSITLNIGTKINIQGVETEIIS